MARSPWGGCITQETFSGKRIWNCLFALLGVKHSDNLPHCQWDTFCEGGGGGGDTGSLQLIGIGRSSLSKNK